MYAQEYVSTVIQRGCQKCRAEFLDYLPSCELNVLFTSVLLHPSSYLDDSSNSPELVFPSFNFGSGGDDGEGGDGEEGAELTFPTLFLGDKPKVPHPTRITGTRLLDIGLGLERRD